MRTSAEPLEGHKVKLTVEVDEEEITKAEDATLRRLTREARVPGFRPGKVPRRLLAARLGPKVIRDEVIRDAVPQYYSDAIEAEALDVIAQPEIDITSGEESGPLVFDAVVEVRPVVSIVGYEGLQVTIPSPDPSEADIDAQVDRLRAQFATLTEVDRSARDGDLVTLDVHGTRDGEAAEGLTADDLVYELGTGGIVEGADDKLRGAKAGDVVDFEAEDAPGGPADLHVVVKLVRERLLPVADDAFASDASEFETVAELRDDLRQRIARVRKMQASIFVRERAIEALIELVSDEVPDSLVAHETEHLLNDFLSRLQRQRIDVADYLASTGQDEQALIDELKDQARRQATADLALRALASAESLEVDETDLDEEIVRIAAQAKQRPAEVRAAFEGDGRLAALRSDLRNAKALAWLVEHVGIIDDEGRPVDRSELVLDDLAAEPADGGHTDTVASDAPEGARTEEP